LKFADFLTAFSRPAAKAATQADARLNSSRNSETAIEVPLPDSLYGIGVECNIGTDESNTFHKALSNQHSVEWVFMVMGQLHNGFGMFRSDWQDREPVQSHRFLDVVCQRVGQLILANRYF
jgi:hypothetical protein